MEIGVVTSVKGIDKQFFTGEKPVLVLCSDMEYYICKYKVTSSPAYKLVCEIIGSMFSYIWKLNSPSMALVRISNNHWSRLTVPHERDAKAFGSRYISSVADISTSTSLEIIPSENNLKQLLKIALFDIWIANEDRNANNYNLLYDLKENNFVPIDFGCILNTASFDWSLSQLTSTDSILSSELYHHMAIDEKFSGLESALAELQTQYVSYIAHSKTMLNSITDVVPKEWGVPKELIRNKMHELFQDKWIRDSWDNFVENLIDNSK